MKKGGSCPNCGYVIRKWAMRCPYCRSYLEPFNEADEKHALGELARRYIRKMEEKHSETRTLV